MSGWEVVRYGGLKGGEEGELNSEQKSSIHTKKVFYIGNGRPEAGELQLTGQIQLISCFCK